MLVVSNAFSISMLEKSSNVSFEKITLEEARELLQNTPNYKSIVGHEGTAKVFEQLLGVNISNNRVLYKLEENDTVIVGNINTRLPEGKILSADELKDLPINWWLVEIK